MFPGAVLYAMMELLHLQRSRWKRSRLERAWRLLTWRGEEEGEGKDGVGSKVRESWYRVGMRREERWWKRGRVAAKGRKGR